jgi:antitoxin component YwqK of YwqJK toxin-antitoxin module
MKLNIVFAVCCAFIISACWEKQVTSLQFRNGLAYEVNQVDPFTGRLKGRYVEATFKDGKKHGLYTEWFNNGQKYIEENYKNGMKDGPYTNWYENGQKKSEGNYKDGKRIGLSTDWYDSGQKRVVGNYDNGIGHLTFWYRSGQIREETTYKDGKKHGLSTLWHKNGDKDREITYKDGIKDGPLKSYAMGKKSSESTFKNGRLINVVKFNN